MQCVDTLSWSVMGLGAPGRPARRNMEALGFGARRAPAARDAQSRVTNHLKKDDPTVDASRLKSLVGGVEATHPNKLGTLGGNPESLRTPAVSPATCQPRTEVRPLEVDWSLIV